MVRLLREHLTVTVDMGFPHLQTSSQKKFPTQKLENLIEDFPPHERCTDTTPVLTPTQRPYSGRGA